MSVSRFRAHRTVSFVRRHLEPVWTLVATNTFERDVVGVQIVRRRFLSGHRQTVALFCGQARPDVTVPVTEEQTRSVHTHADMAKRNSSDFHHTILYNTYRPYGHSRMHSPLCMYAVHAKQCLAECGSSQPPAHSGWQPFNLPYWQWPTSWDQHKSSGQPILEHPLHFAGSSLLITLISLLTPLAIWPQSIVVA